MAQEAEAAKAILLEQQEKEAELVAVHEKETQKWHTENQTLLEQLEAMQKEKEMMEAMLEEQEVKTLFNSCF